LKKECGHLIEEFDRTADEIGFLTSQLQGSVLSVRMLPLDTLFAVFPRAVRDLAKELAKEVALEIHGEETELDKTMIEAIRDPLLHLLRNAVDHGMESPQERKRLGKPQIGRIDLRAYTRGSQVVIEVQDDGRGIDSKQIKAAAIRQGLLTQEEAQSLSDAEALDILYTPGFTTQTKVSMTSGRGVGLNVVRENVTNLKGLVELSSVLGQGTKFTLKLPLTLAVSLALFVEAYDEAFAIPLDHVLETLRVTQEAIKSVERREAISVRDEIIPLIRLGEVLGLERPKGSPNGPNDERETPVVIVGLAERKLAILVYSLKGKAEVVVKGLGDHLKKVAHIAGGTILGSGEIVLILDIPSLVRESSALPGLVKSLPGADANKRLLHSILVVEDSLITRDLEKSILESAGYKVGVAKDGLEALRNLSQDAYDLVITDISMPQMDGIELIAKMKQDKRLCLIPTIVLSSKESQEDKKRGLEAGASAYLAKSQFDQGELMKTIERLLG
jgi:two-component system chemotaxis sensor kinase CheA